MIEIWQDGDEGAAKIGKVEMVEGSIVLTMDQRTADYLTHFQCLVNGRDVYSIEDGRPWLDALPDNLNGSRLRAVKADG